MPFKKIGPDKYRSPSGRIYTYAQVKRYYARGGKFDMRTDAYDPNQPRDPGGEGGGQWVGGAAGGGGEPEGKPAGKKGPVTWYEKEGHTASVNGKPTKLERYEVYVHGKKAGTIRSSVGSSTSEVSQGNKYVASRRDVLRWRVEMPGRPAYYGKSKKWAVGEFEKHSDKFKDAYNPNQPRDPKGAPTGGQWTGIGHGFQKVSGAKGSNEGGVYEDQTGKKYYVKLYKNIDQGRVEVLANGILQRLGIRTVDSQIGKVGGREAIIAPWNESFARIKPSVMEKFTSSRHLSQLADMEIGAKLTKNWDIVGLEYDNVVLDKLTDDLIAVDQGGSFHFRAQGAPKEYGPDPSDTDFTKSNNAATRVFKQVDEGRRTDAVNRLTKIPVKDLFDQSGLKNADALYKNYVTRAQRLRRWRKLADAQPIGGGMPMPMQFIEDIMIDDASVRETAAGYLTAYARVARTGIQIYRGSECGDASRDRVRVYRPPEEVFDAKAMASFAHQPITILHPRGGVTADNWKQVAVGNLDGDVVRDGNFVRVPLILMDAGAIKKYKDGMRELSMGYNCELSWEDGVSPEGEPYDAVQRTIRANHLAMVPVARGGADLRIGDEDDFGLDDEDDAYNPNQPRDPGGEGGGRWVKSGATEEEQEGNFGPRDKKGKKHNSNQGYNAEAVNKAIQASNRAGRRIGGKEAKLIHRLLRGRDSSDLDEILDTAEFADAVSSTLGEAEGEVLMSKTMVVDGITVEMTDTAAQVVTRALANATKVVADAEEAKQAAEENFKKKKKEYETETDAMKKDIQTKDGQIAALTKQLSDAQLTPDKLDALVADRSSVIEKVQAILGDKYDPKGKTTDAMKREAVTKVLGEDATKPMEVAAIDGAFAILSAGKGNVKVADVQRPGGARKIAAGFRGPTQDAGDERAKAWADEGARMRDAWKVPGGQA